MTFNMFFQRDRLFPGQFLKKNQRLISKNRRYNAVYQSDGNFVVYTKNNKALWASNTQYKAPGKLILQRDGNLVIYNKWGKAVWYSNTYRKPSKFLVMQNNGNLVLYMNKAIWASNTQRE